MEAPLNDVDADIANVLAYDQHKRWIDENLVWCYPGQRHSPAYERRRALEVVEQSLGYYATIDVHNNSGGPWTTASIHPERGVSPIALGLLRRLSIAALLTSDLSFLPYVENSMMLDMAKYGLATKPELVRRELDAFANDEFPEQAHAGDFQWYRDMGSAHISHFHPDELAPIEDELQAFQPLPPAIAAKFGHPGEQLHLITWRYNPNPQGYWGELVSPIPVPDTSNWPRR
jgi:hypothetical protein